MKGYTLIELMITVAIIGIIVMAISQFSGCGDHISAFFSTF